MNHGEIQDVLILKPYAVYDSSYGPVYVVNTRGAFLRIGYHNGNHFEGQDMTPVNSRISPPISLHTGTVFMPSQRYQNDSQLSYSTPITTR